jgi:selenocysteine lyase/cysteine desulfurase
MKRRTFLRNSFLSGAAIGVPSGLWGMQDGLAELDYLSTAIDDTDAGDEYFWSLVRNEFTVSPNIINLNNGGVSPQPKSVQEAHIRYYQFANEGPSYYMWRILDQGRESLRKRLADLAGSDPEEIAINRNATEGLNSVIFGLNLKSGDEVVLCKYDYPNMINAWKQREKREGIKLVWVDLDLPSEDKNYLINQYAKAVTSKTRVVHLTHMINWSGQLLPVKEIVQSIKRPDVYFISDSAHSFAHVQFGVGDLGCDYMATSLHKWLCAPFGSGLLWMNKEKIKDVWALLSSPEPDSDDIRKMESLGTRSFASEMAIGAAIDFHEMIGGARKEKRLRQLKDYWMLEAKKIKGVKLYTPTHTDFSCALGVFGIEGKSPAEIEQFLFNKYGIHSVGIDYEKIYGVRITPSVYTSFKELDRLLEGINALSKT